MKTQWIFSLALLLSSAACSSSDDKPMVDSDDGVQATVADKTDVHNEEVAIARRSLLMDGRTSCILKADAETWKTLSLTSDQIRWMEDLKARMSVPDNKVTNDRDGSTYMTYSLSSAERRKMAEILTDEQLIQWLGMCPGQGEVTTAQTSY